MRSSRGGTSVFMALLLLCLTGQGACRAQDAPTAEVQRSQELVEEERLLRKRMIEEGKIYVKDIVVKGLALPPAELEEIIAPFEDAWLHKQRDLDRLIDLIQEAYVRHGYERPTGLSYVVDEGTLTIDFSEIRVPF